MIVTIQYHREHGVWWAESEQLPGFSSAADTFAEIAKLVRESIDNYPDDLGDVELREEFEGAILVPPNGVPHVDPGGWEVHYPEPVTTASASQTVESPGLPRWRELISAQ